MRSLQNKHHFVTSQFRQLGSCVESVVTASNNTQASQSAQVTPRRLCSPQPTARGRNIFRTAPVRSESNIPYRSMTRAFGQFQQQVGNQTQTREQEPDHDPQQNQGNSNEQLKQQALQQNLKLRTKFQLRESKFSQNNFEIESASAESSEEHEVNQEFARNHFESDIKRQQGDETEQFINIYKREYGMPSQKGNETDVKDYLFKLLEFKNSSGSDELSSDDILIQRTKKIIEIENDTATDKSVLNKNKREIEDTQSLIFKKVKNKGLLVFKKQQDECAYRVVFVRHGQSIWNKEGRCSGWIDVPLNEKGKKEAHQAGNLLRDLDYKFDLSYTSYLSRAKETNRIILEELGQPDVETVHAWQMNERHYGALEGRYKAQLEKDYGTQQVRLWRQSYDNPPPSVSYDDTMHPRFDPLYAHLSEAEQRKLPTGESLEMVASRVAPYWQEKIIPHMNSLGRDKVMLFTAHQHICRAMVKTLTGVDNKTIQGVRIPNAAPFVFEFNSNMKPIHNYYADDEEVEVVASQKIETKETLFMHGR